MRWIIGLSAVFGAFAYAFAIQSSDTNCVSWDDRIEHDLFQPLRRKLQEFSSEYKNFSGADLGWYKFNVNWQGGTSGNYSSFHLNRIAGENASSFCDVSGEQILSASFVYDDLRATFKNVEMYTPFFSLGDFEPSLIFEGLKIFAYINVTTDATSQQCNATLGWFLLEGFDSLHLEMSGGIFSWLATKVFNWFASPRIAEFLKSYSENQRLSFQVKQFLAPAVQAEKEFFCKVIR